jgi:uncharacterized repeat protein (TIGR01451 family)
VNSARSVVVGLAVITAGMLVPMSSGAAAAPPEPAAGCTGGIAPNPSVEQRTGSGQPVGYTFAPAVPIPPATPANKVPRLATDTTYSVDGSQYALIQTLDGRVSTAYADVPAADVVPGGAYTLTDWTGTHGAALAATGSNQYTGLQFYDGAGKQILENKLPVTHDVDSDRKVARQDFAPSVAPAGTASVKFFASTNYSRVEWDCVFLQLAAYTVKKEVQDPASGNWGGFAVIPAGDTAKYRITVTNAGTQQLSNVTVKDPWCAAQPAGTPFSLAAGASKQVTCEHPNADVADGANAGAATVTGVTFPGGKLADQTAAATTKVTPQDKLGDLVWSDTNGNGVADPDEPGVQGANVTLKDEKGATVTTATTGEDGKYLFDKLAGGTFQVCLDTQSLPMSVAGYHVSNACTAMTTLGASKHEDLTLDFGLVAPVKRLSGFAWVDADENGLQDAGEAAAPGVKASLVVGGDAVAATTVTGEDGTYLFDNLGDGGYQVCFAIEAPQAATKQNAGDDTKDSDADPTSGCTQTTTLSATRPEDHTLDVGFMPFSTVPVGVSPTNR